MMLDPELEEYSHTHTAPMSEAYQNPRWVGYCRTILTRQVVQAAVCVTRALQSSIHW